MFRQIKFAAALAFAVATSGLVPGIAQAEPSAAEAASVAEERHLVVKGGYQPSKVEVTAGRPIRLVFERREFSSCTREVVFPTLGIRRELPPNEKVAIELGPQPAGEIEFHCGMKMIRGKVVVAPAS